MNETTKSPGRSIREMTLFMREHAAWFSVEALVIAIFMVAHLGIRLEESTSDIDLETLLAGLACGACVGGMTTAIVAFTALLLLTAMDFWSPRD